LFLQYFENEDSAQGNSQAKNTLSLKFCRKVDVDLNHSSYKNVFSVHLPERIYYFSAPSHFEMIEWSDTICTHLQINQDKPMMNTAQFNTLPASSQFVSKTYSPTIPSPTLPIRGLESNYGLAGPYVSPPQSAGLYNTSGQLSISGHYGTAGAYGTTGQFSSSLSSHYGMAGAYGTTGIYGGSGKFSTSLPTGQYSRPFPVSTIQQRDLPAIPSENNIGIMPPSVTSDNEKAPPVPPRFHNSSPNHYSVAPTR
jgi:hypothetical protein